MSMCSFKNNINIARMEYIDMYRLRGQVPRFFQLYNEDNLPWT